MIDDTAMVTLTVDVDALSFTLEEDGGDAVTGMLLLTDEDEWAECCYLNGAGHTQFETYLTDPASFTVGPVDITDGALTANLTIQEFEPAADADEGFRFE